ncbi:MAG TPA: hypothetical protein VFV84_06570 [Burkholderiales bacterium]|nr:hypothetical protein [Burkholderiales bacterium]
MAPALRPEFDGEHPVIAWTGIVAVVAAILLILWARFEVHGTHDLRSTLTADDPKPAAHRQKPSPDADKPVPDREVDEAVAAGRWAAGFSP